MENRPDRPRHGPCPCPLVLETDLLAGNAAALASAQPALVVPPDSDLVQVINGNWRLVEHGRRLALHSREPERESRTLVDTLLDVPTPPTVIVAIGLALGYILDRLDERGWTGTVLAFEPEPATVPKLFARRDLRAWIGSGRLRFLLGPDFAGTAECWRLFERVPTAAVAVIANPVLERQRAPLVERARALVTKIRFDADANWKARQKHGGPYLLHTLRNLPVIAREGDVRQLTGMATGAPAFIVAAGPSLDAALPLLRDAQASSLIISVDTALRPLLAAGIEPHLAVAVDPGENNARHLIDLPPCARTFLVAEASLDPLAFNGFAGRTFLFTVSNHQPWPWLRGFGADAGRLRAWGSVLTTAYDLAIQTGANPVVFVGADLAFSGGRTYCSGTTYDEDWSREADWGHPRDAQWSAAMNRWPDTFETGVNDTPVPTAPHLVAFRDWLVDDTRRQAGCRFVNATGDGILLGGAIEISNPSQARREIGATPRDFAAIVRERHRPAVADPAELRAGAQALLGALDTPDGAALLDTWLTFAPGLNRGRIAAALRAGLGLAAAPPPRPPASLSPVYADPGVEGQWLSLLTPSVALTPMRMAAHRLRALPSGARQFRFRSTTARVITSVLRPPEGAVAENGVPLARAIDLDHIAPGTYSICRDEVHFRATDNTDPRTNGREYTVLVTPPVAYVESLPLQQILEGRL